DPTIRQAGQEVRSQVALWQLELVRIVDLHQIQTIGMGGNSPGTPVTRQQHLFRPFHRTLAGTDGHQYAGEITHHVMQEGIGADVQDDEATLLQDLQVMDRLYWRLGLALAGAEGAE